MAALIFVGCFEDNEIEPVIDAALPECQGNETRECFVEDGCVGTQTCSDGSFGTCEAPAEVCDGVDNDCDGVVDNGFDNLGQTCDAGEGVCADKGTIVCNADGTDVECNASPGDGTDEMCDGVDNDCNGIVDDGLDEGMECDTGRLGACGAGTSTCQDGDTRCEPIAEPTDEVCDGIDNDCDGRTDEGAMGGPIAQPCYDGPEGTEGVGACAAGVQVCTDGDFGACADQVVPGDEICDGIDNDCNGETDDAEGVECVCVPGEMQPCYGGPEGTEGIGVCRGGMQTCNEDGTGYGECEGQRVPRVELCDTLDNDCDGEVDNAIGVGEDCTVGQGLCADTGTRVCDLESGQVVCDAEEGLPEDEICDGVDNDCDGTVDDVEGAGQPCTIGQGACESRGVLVCGKGIGGGLVCNAEVIDPVAEVCDGVDNDCNGVVDDAPGVGEDCEVGLGQCRSTAVTVCDPAAGQVVCPATEQDPAGELCNTGLDEDCDGEIDEEDCSAPCQTDEQCGPGAICEDSACVPGCRDDEGCGFQEICEDGQCVPGDCRGDEDCDDGELCIEGFCTEGDCRVDEDCLPGQLCSANSCIDFPLECLDPPSIGFGTVVGSNVGAGDDFQGSCNPSSEDVVYRLDLAGYVGPVCVTTDGSDYDTKLFARSECGRQDSELDCNDDGGVDLDSEIQIDVDGDAFVFVDGFGQSTGNFVLTVEQGPCACRENDDCADGEACRLGTCEPIACGDGIVEGPEQCDDGGTDAGDGCSDICEVEAGWTCDEATGACAEIEGLFAGITRTPGELLPENGIAPGGEAFVNECAGDQVIYGAEAALGGGIDRMRALCADIQLGGDRLVLDPGGTTTSVGNPEAEFAGRVVCPPNHAVSGYVAYLPAGISLLCTPVDLDGGRLSFGEPIESEILGAGAVEAAREACPAGTAAGAHAGRADDAGVYAFSLRCDAFTDDCTGASGCEPIGDCFDDDDCGEDEVCFEFNCTGGEVCNDGVGNNGNDLVDCFDELFCADHPSCNAGACEVDEDCGGNPCIGGVCGLNLGIPLAIAQPGHHTGTFGELDDADPTWARPNAACAGGGAEGGYFYEMRTIVNATGAQQQVTIQTQDPDFDGYLHVFADPFDPALTPEGCIAGNDDFGGGSRVTNVEIAPGQRLVLVISTFNEGVTGAYTVDVITQDPREECTDGLDNDDDGLFDCEDPDCDLDPVCALPEVCDDGRDNDQDGDVDCEDFDCIGTPECGEFVCVPDEFEGQGEEVDATLMEGEYTDLTICEGDEGPDAFFVPVCEGGTVRVTVTHGPAFEALLLMGYLEEPEPRVEEPTVNGTVTAEVTNDQGFENTAIVIETPGELLYDLTIDVIGCDPEPEICDDGRDNDFNGDVDCEDEACLLDPVCLEPEICDDSIGNNGNFATDCLDEACVDHPSCQYEPEVEGQEPQAIAAPGHFVGFTGVMDGDEMMWDRLSADCAPQGAPDHFYQAYPIVNLTGAPQALRVTGTWADDDGYLHVFRDPFDPADPAGCVTGDDDLDGTDQSRVERVEIAPDEVLWLVVSTFDGGDVLGQADLEVLTLPDEVCDDGFDNDDDRLTDCFDDDCALDPVCEGQLPELCGDGEDNDNDGWVDCLDPDCLDSLECGPAGICPIDDVFEDESDNLPGPQLIEGLTPSLALCDDDIYRVELCDGGTITVTVVFDHEAGDIDVELGVTNLEEVVVVADSSDDNEVLTYTNELGEVALMDIFINDTITNTPYAIDVVIEGCLPVIAACEAPTVIDGPGTYEGTTADGSNDVPSAPCQANANGNEAVFQVNTEVPTTMCLTATGFDTVLYARTDDCATGESAGCDDDTPGVPGNGSQLELTTEPGVDYFVFLDGFNGQGGDYTLEVEPGTCAAPGVELCANGADDDADGDVDCDDEDCADDPACAPIECPVDIEPNDEIATANPVMPGTYACGVIGPDGDEDYTAVDVCAGGTLTATLSGFLGDFDIFLYDADGNVLDSGFTLNPEETAEFTSAIDQTIYVRVDGAGAAAGPYILDLGLAGCECPVDIEPNDEIATANPVMPGAYACGEIGPDGDEDFTAVDVCAGGTLTATLGGFVGDFDVFIYDGDGNELDSGFTLNPEETAEATSAVAQTLYVRVDAAGLAAGGYTLELALADCDGPVVEICDNGADDDGNGDIDCADEACAADPACQLGQCPADDRFEPNDSREEATPLMAGQYDELARCTDDDYYVFDVCGAGTITVDALFTHADGDIDIQLQNADGGQLALSQSSTDNESVQYTLPSDMPDQVFLRVYFRDNSYSLDIGITCPEICANGMDDDGDLAVDCDDDDCVDHPACNPLQTEVLLENTEAAKRTREVNLGNLIADSLRWQGTMFANMNGGPAPDVAITNAGGIQDDVDLEPGEITDDYINDVLLPFGNTVVIVQALERADLLANLESAVSQVAAEAGRFPQIAGFSFVWDSTALPGGRIVDVTLDDGTVIVENGAVVDGPPLVVATNSFIAEDRDGYVFPDEQADTTVDMRDALRGYIVNMLAGVVTAEDYPVGGEGRITAIVAELAGVNCDDGVDNDGDGTTDCNDPGCVDDEACQPPPLGCGSDEDCPGNAVCRGGLPPIGLGECIPTGVCAPGGDIYEPNDTEETAFAIPGEGRYTPAAVCGESDYFTTGLCPGGTLTIELYFSHADGDIDLAVIGGPDSDTANDDEAVELTNDGAEPQTVVWRVFGFGAAQNGYAMDVTIDGCGVEDVCDDGEDNDDDGAADCEDPDCADDPFCAPEPGGELVITEFMQNPSAANDNVGEWFELYNGTAGDIDLNGWIISDDDNDSFVIDRELIIPAGGYLVFGINGDPAVNGGIDVDFDYDGFSLANGDDEIVVSNPAGVEMAAVRYDNGATFPDGNGASAQFGAEYDPSVVNTADGANWCEAVTPYGDGDTGTPGGPNERCTPLVEPPVPIADLSQSIVFDGSIDEGDMLWELPNEDCTPRGNGSAYPYDSYRIINETGADQIIDLTAVLPQDGTGDGMLHVFDGDFDPAVLDNCVAGADNADRGTYTGIYLGSLPIAAGQTMTVVLSSELPDPDGQLQPIGGASLPYFGDYTLDVLTAAPNPVDFCRLQFPAEIDGTAGDVVTVYGRIYEQGFTDRSPRIDRHSRISGQVGYIADGDDPADMGNWTWTDAEPNFAFDNAGEENNDEYQAGMTLPPEGIYSYAFRFTVDSGASWQMCDLDGAGANLDADDPASTFSIDEAGLMITGPDACTQACDSAQACNFFALAGAFPQVPQNYEECLQACDDGEITDEQAECVNTALDNGNNCGNGGQALNCFLAP